MRIDESSIADMTVTSPNYLFNELNSINQTLGISPVLELEQNTRGFSSGSRGKKQSKKTIEYKQPFQGKQPRRKDGNGLKRLIKEQKISIIIRQFIAKLKLNNINSPPVEFNPYEHTQTKSIFDLPGVQISDWIQKLFSFLIVLTIFICVVIETTSIAFGQVKQNSIVRYFQVFSLGVFLLELVFSIIMVRTVDGRKLITVGQIFSNYFKDGLIIDLVYLIVLIVDVFSSVGWVGLVILLKLPQCFERVQKLQNAIINTFYKQQYWGLTKVFLLNFSLSHILSILLITMSNLDTANSWLTNHNRIDLAPPLEQYVWSFYWGTTIMLTVGFGDIAPANYQQALCLVLIETFSCLALAYNINCVGNLISNIKSQDVGKNKNIKTFKLLCNRNDLSQSLEMKINNYIEESTNIKKKFNFEEQSKFIQQLPRQLKAQFLKQSNKRIFQNIVFFKNLTEKTLLNFAEVIQTKICHPEEIIKKRGQIAGIMILKQGKIGLATKLNGSNYNGITIQTLHINESQKPFLLSLDFLSNDRTIYEIKSEQYSILYYLDRQKTLQVLRTSSQLDYQHYCFLRDKCRNLESDFQVLLCQECEMNHSRFQCPKLHYMPLKKHVIDKYLYLLKHCKTKRKFIRRKKNVMNAFEQLQTNQKVFELKTTMANKYVSYKRTLGGNTPKGQQQFDIKKTETIPQTITKLFTQTRIPGSYSQTLYDQRPVYPHQIETEKRIEYQYMAGYIKDELEKIISNNSQVWLIETDEVKNFKFYFVSYNAGTLEYLNRKTIAKVGKR